VITRLPQFPRFAIEVLAIKVEDARQSSSVVLPGTNTVMESPSTRICGASSSLSFVQRILEPFYSLMLYDIVLEAVDDDATFLRLKQLLVEGRRNSLTAARCTIISYGD
jgi:hypothetical protein